MEVVCDRGKVVAIDTSLGSIECDYYVNCGGFWARKIGQLSNPMVKIPLHPVEHYYLRTNPIQNLDPLTPGNLMLCGKISIEKIFYKLIFLNLCIHTHFV